MEFVIPGTKTPDGDKAMAVLEACLKRGLVGYMAGLKGQVIRLIPPLNVTGEQVDEALGILAESLAAV